MIVSDMTLGGITDPRAERHFMEAMERLNIRTLMPHAGVDYLVDGTFVGSLMQEDKTNKLFDIMPHRADNCRFDSLPFFGQDPIITCAIPDEFRKVLQSDSKRAKSLRDKLGKKAVDLFNNTAVELDPLTTVYVPRRAFSTGEGVSWFRRILPLYLIEKNLFRGTLVESARRQRGILHLSLGDGDQWEPTRQDMEFMTELFMNADSDPLGAVIATRLGVTTEEIRQGGDFWKVTDLWDSTATFKMRSLGLSESLLSGEQNLAAADANMTVFVEWLRSFRDYLTQKTLYNKVFPLISMTHGYTVNAAGKLIKRDSMLSGDVERNLATMADGSRLLIPTVHYARQLKPEGDSTYMEMLNTLTEKGIPVPLRALAAAGGFNLDALLADSEDNLALTKRVMEYARKQAEYKSKYGPKEAAEGEALAAASYQTAIASNSRSSVLAQGTGKHVGLFARDYGDSGEIYATTRTGKKKYIPNQRVAQERANKSIANAMAGITKNKKTALTHTTVAPKGKL